MYKKMLYYKNKQKAFSNFDKIIKIMKEIQQESESNNVPTATLSSIIWHAFQDFEEDDDIKPKAGGNILYLRQDHNVNENRGNLFKNILYLDKANTDMVEKTNIGYNARKSER
jgi:hypothetical protein